MKQVWSEYKLDELFTISSGLSKSAKEFGHGYPFLSFKEVFYNYFVPDIIKDLANTTEKERNQCSIKNGDVFLTRTSETQNELGMSSVALKDIPNATFNGFTKRLRPKIEGKIYPKYSAYFFRSGYFRKNITAFSSITTRASLNNGIIAKLLMLLPPYDVQKKIGDLLYTIDYKIEINKQLNDNLLQLMSLLFTKYIINEIDDSWQESSLDEIADYLNGLAMQKLRPTGEEFIPVIKIREMRSGFSDNTERARPDIPEQYIINDGDILFSWSGTLDVVIWCNGKGGLNQHLFKVTSELYPKWFYYLWTCYHLQQFQMIAATKVTTMGHIKREELKKAKVYIPKNDVMDKLDRVMTPLINEYIEISIQNRKLTEIRDTLLPRLMSGEIDLEEVNINE